MAAKHTRSFHIPYGVLIPVITVIIVYCFLRITYLQKNQFTAPSVIFTPLGAPITTTGATTPTPETKQSPTGVNIPKIHKNLPVQASIVQGNNWGLFDTSVAWLSTSAIPGEGNVILYAHNWMSLWGELYKLSPGDMVEVDQNGKTTQYIVTESRAVNATDVASVLSKENRLTMFTCEGTFDQKRRVVYAKPL